MCISVSQRKWAVILILVDGQAFTGKSWGFTWREWETIPYPYASRSWVLNLKGLGSKVLSLRWGGEGTPLIWAQGYLYSKRTQSQAKTGPIGHPYRAVCAPKLPNYIHLGFIYFPCTFINLFSYSQSFRLTLGISLQWRFKAIAKSLVFVFLGYGVCLGFCLENPLKEFRKVYVPSHTLLVWQLKFFITSLNNCKGHNFWHIVNTAIFKSNCYIIC